MNDEKHCLDESSYRSYPSSKARKSVAQPESLDMKVIVPMGMRVCSSFCAVMMGPTALVLRWLEKFSKDLIWFSQWLQRSASRCTQLSRSLIWSTKAM